MWRCCRTAAFKWLLSFPNRVNINEKKKKNDSNKTYWYNIIWKKTDFSASVGQNIHDTPAIHDCLPADASLIGIFADGHKCIFSITPLRIPRGLSNGSC